MAEARLVTEMRLDVEVVDRSVRFTYTGETQPLLEHLVQFEIDDVSIGNPQLDTIFKHYYRDDSAGPAP
mgnify:CR=1 FL=1